MLIIFLIVRGNYGIKIVSQDIFFCPNVLLILGRNIQNDRLFILFMYSSLSGNFRFRPYPQTIIRRFQVIITIVLFIKYKLIFQLSCISLIIAPRLLKIFFSAMKMYSFFLLTRKSQFYTAFVK